MSKCPFCAEEIQDQDLSCPYCGRDLKSSLPDNDLKKCPFCAEWIRKEAIVCRYCKRELTSEIDNTKPSGIKANIFKKAEDLTLGDISQFFSSWEDSYGNIPNQVKEKISDSLRQITRGYLAEVMGELLRYRLISDKEFSISGQQAAGYSWQWAIICYAIGLEGVLGNIDDKNVPFYLNACTNPLGFYLLGLLGILLINNKLKADYVIKIRGELRTFLTKTSVFYANLGYIYYKNVQPKYEGKQSPLAKNLLNIDIDKLKRTTK